MKRLWGLFVDSQENSGGLLQHQPIWKGGLALWGMNLVLRFWRLGTPRLQAFDEVYYVRFAIDILQSQPFFDAHPPLGKYLIALSMVCFQIWHRLLGFAAPSLVELVNNPVSYRWLNAGIGAGIPLLGGWVAWEWSRDYPQRRKRFAALTALLLSSNGLLLVESRLALLHIALVGFGLIGLAAWGRSHHSPTPLPWRLLAGSMLGACINVKWNGAAYLLALGCLAGIRYWRDRFQHRPHSPSRPWLWLGLLPCGIYLLCWLPYLTLTENSLLNVHISLWQFHQNATVNHPYQSPWYSWPLMVRPIAYFYQGLRGNESVGIGPPTPSPETAIALYGLDNPFLVWLSTAAIALLILKEVSPVSPANSLGKWVSFPQTGLVVTYLAHWLPWALIQRTTFFYHYLPAALIAEMALAWLMSDWLVSDRPSWRWTGWSLLGVICAGFLFWLPLWIGWPLSIEALQQRLWLPSWR